MNDVTKDNFLAGDQTFDRTYDIKDHDVTGRSNLNQASKRSEAGLNAQENDEDHCILYDQPDLEKMFNNKGADRNGLSDQVFDNFIKEWG